MGREIRRVPLNWEHPTRECRHSPWAGGCSDAKRNNGRCYQPLYDEDFESAMKEWLDGLAQWLGGGFQEVLRNHPGDYNETEPYRAYCEHEGDAPDPEYYRSPWTAEPTAYQMYETISEGTPVSPVCATKEDLVEYLVNHGDTWSQWRAQESGGDPRWSREAAEGFVRTEFAMSAVIANGHLIEPKDAEMYSLGERKAE